MSRHFIWGLQAILLFSILSGLLLSCGKTSETTPPEQTTPTEPSFPSKPQSIIVLPFVGEKDVPDWFPPGLSIEIRRLLSMGTSILVYSEEVTVNVMKEMEDKKITSMDPKYFNTVQELHGDGLIVSGKCTKDQVFVYFTDPKANLKLQYEIKGTHEEWGKIAAQFVISLITSWKIEVDEKGKKELMRKPTSSTEAYALFVPTWILYSDGKMDQAIKNLEDAIALDPEFDDAFARLAYFYYYKGDLEKSKSLYKMLLSRYQKSNDPSWRFLAIANEGLGMIASEQKETLTARDFYAQADQCAKNAQYHRIMVSVLYRQGDLDKSEGNFAQAVAFYSEAKKLAEQYQRPKDVGIAIAKIAAIHIDEGKPDLAVEGLKTYMKIMEEYNDQRGIAIGHRSLGDAYLAMQDYDNATSFYQKSIERCEAIGDKKNLARSTLGLGIAYMYFHKFDEALNEFKKAEKIYESAFLTKEAEQKNLKGWIKMAEEKEYRM